MCSSLTACTRNTSRQTIRRWISSRSRASTSIRSRHSSNQLLVPGVKKVSDSDLKKFSANLDETAENVSVSIRYGNMSYQWKANRNSGRIAEANVTYKDKGNGDSRLNLKYSDFKSVGVKMFPATQRMTLTTILNNKPQEAKLNIEMKSVKTDDKWDAQTEVSGKYKQVSPKDVLGKLMSM